MNLRTPLALGAVCAARVCLYRGLAASLAAVSLVCASPGALAMTRTPHIRPRAVAPEREPVPTHHHSASSHAAPGSAHASAPTASAHPVAKFPVAKLSARSHAAAPTREAFAHAVPTTRAAQKLVETASAGQRKAAAPAPRLAPTTPSKPRAAQVAVSKPARPKAPARTLTSDDFERAAGMTPSPKPSPETLAEGVSHPAEMNDDAPLTELPAPAVTRRAESLPAVSAAAEHLQPVPAVARVDGFGAEGDTVPTTHRTLSATMAAHKAEFAAVPRLPEPSAAERAEITEEAAKPMVLPAIYSKGGRLVMPAPLKGSHDVLVHQNTMADAEGLDRIQDDDTLNRMIGTHELLRLPESASLEVNEDLPVERRYARPWTVRFATDAGKAFAARFGEPLRVNSAVRTVSYQLRLMRVNGNAAAVAGESASPHLTGQAIDIGKRGMTSAEIAWMRAFLGPLMSAGKIDVEEEFQQACFHISVYRGYLPAAKKSARTEVAASAPVEKHAAGPSAAITEAPTTDQ